ncbi:MAG: DUF1289 domain-containing protein [Methylobacterium sp.]|uniref:DUF1289 domain-containing protein n=1 Tax=Methylobacterium sp. TaxID=409 RepID=UPI0025844354|nr:DUF1289 domain-containing protein [Methylobacterium sp.]MBY0297788.1 DUF1289 domain-containing protein [Methylobacterium sp.]
MPPPSSPCTRICVLDPVTGLCEGCGRTRDEIAAWGSLSEPERKRIMALLPDRLAAAVPGPARRPVPSPA